MSIAGIRSNRGDGYQTLVAFDWALIVLSDPDFEWLEVDSISYPVDDVVVGKADGTLIACQCKKNQTDFKAWTISDLRDELDKASLLLAENPSASVRFYSRNNFGDLAKLKEHSSSQPDEINYLQSLGKAQGVLNDTLDKLLNMTAPDLSVFQFLCRTNFITSDDLDQMELQLRRHLRSIASNHEAAFNALWVSIEKLGARLGDGSSSATVMHRLTKSDLQSIVQQSGSTLVPPMGIAEIRHSFSSTSAIGRSWRRDIAGQRIANPLMDELLTAIDARKRSILLTGLPGSGKTCVMLELQETLEKRAINRSDMMPLFIQSREFADFATPEERQVQGLSQQWVEKAARLAENTYVIVVIDSLDVLSIAREHHVLQYFLAQIDRLLLIPNITVVTACREFDRHYDRRIADRHWDCELECQSLNWDDVVAPLLDKLGIAVTEIDIVTRELIRNPRELALFAELAVRGGSFNVVTSHALAQRYLNSIVLADVEMGDIALQAIEALATEMLRMRSLTVPRQRFIASLDIQRKLCSLNVLQETIDGKLTFGHQTLLDILVISRALRNGVTLNEFIKDLPPVPFVRPSIRSYIAQLAIGERREFRKQLRTVFTSNAAFHIRRLAAESFAEQKPQNDDWSLIRDLRENYRDVFQVIYNAGNSIEWHHFWIKYLVPYFKITQDIEGIEMHVHRVVQWSSVDTAGTITFWMEVLNLSWFDGSKISDQLAMHLSRIKTNNINLILPLVIRLLKMPQTEHSSLGKIVAVCVTAGAMSEYILWQYMTEEIKEEDIVGYRFNHRLRCQYHEFGDKKFLHQHMVKSNALLDLALDAVEFWSHIRSSRYDKTDLGYVHGFLNETSFAAIHGQRGLHHKDSVEILFDAIESAILRQATIHSNWWQINCERICFNQEGALVYFGVLACTALPKSNIDIIGRMLSDRDLLEFELSYELSKLIKSAFSSLSCQMQDAVMECISSLRIESTSDYSNLRKLKAQAEYITPIPCHLRSPDLQTALDEYERMAGTIILQPRVSSQGGWVSAPFSYDVFLSITNSGILKLLSHYDGYNSLDWNDFLIGGEEQVGRQLSEAASRQPFRFINFLHHYWLDIPPKFRDNILNGVITYLAHRYGNLSANDMWEPLEEPDAEILAEKVIAELERNSTQFRRSRISARAIEACANVIQELQVVERLIFLAIDFAGFIETDSIEGDNIDLINIGINMAKGDIADALMILTNRILERDDELPYLLPPTLRRFANDEHPAVRALILRRLPLLQSIAFNLGWDLFTIATKESAGLWQIAEQCLYYAYHNHYATVKPLLLRLRSEGIEKDLESWGRISALASITGHIDFKEFIADLNVLNSAEAWTGAASVWTNIDNLQKHREHCLVGIDTGLKTQNEHALAVAELVALIFEDNERLIFLSTELFARCFSAFKKESYGDNKYHRFFRIHEWLNAVSQQNPAQALAFVEIYLDYSTHINHYYLYDHNDSLSQLMTRLFADAEEREDFDSGEMLKRVVVIQDKLLSMGVEGVANWLKAAERP